jgi:hypothetical protein
LQPDCERARLLVTRPRWPWSYRGTLCELASLGFTIESLLQTERLPFGAAIPQAA